MVTLKECKDHSALNIQNKYQPESNSLFLTHQSFPQVFQVAAKLQQVFPTLILVYICL